MKYVHIILIILFGIKTIDILFTKAFTLLARKHFLQKEKIREQSKKDGIEHEASKSFVRIILFDIFNYYEGWIRYKIIGIGRWPFQNLRKQALKIIYGMKIGKRTVIYGGFEIRDPWNVVIGNGSIIGDGAKLDGRRGLIIGNNVNLSTGVWIWTEQHSVDDPSFRVGSGGSVIIEDRAWVSSRVSILPRVHISEGAVIACGAVVTKDCDSYSVYAGIPSKKIKEREKNLTYEFDGSYLPFG